MTAATLGLDPSVALGAPEDIARAKRSYTGKFLKPVLERRENKRKPKMTAAE